MKLFELKKALNANAQAQLAGARNECASMLASMSDNDLLALYVVCRELASQPGILGTAGILAIQGWMEVITVIAKKQQQESN